jgi:TMEM175 potassium channel family protein
LGIGTNVSKRTPYQPNSVERKENASDQDHLGLERLIFFSDAVFAIAITLLALDIRLPIGGEAPSNAQLLDQLLGAWHKYLAYIISFLAIGSFWMAHHRRFQFIKRYDRGLLMLNLLFLMVIAFVPFPTSVISESGNRTATIFYALTMTVAGLMLTAIWWYATRHSRLTDAHLDAQQRRRQLVALLLTVALFVLSIGLAFLDENLARFWWLLVLPISRYGQRRW